MSKFVLHLCRLSKLFRFKKKSLMGQYIVSLLSYLQFRILKIFSSITIESHAFCNRSCEFCPNNEKYPPRKKGRLQHNVYSMIVKQLGDINYVGRISPHLYGEPLLDNRLPEFIAETRLSCPLANIVVMSNGDLLTRDILVSLVSSGMDEIYITNYDLEDNPVVIALQKEFPDHVTVRNFKDVDKRNKAGILDNVVKVQDNKRPCLRPGSQMVINWEGQVILCCNDYYAKHVIGSVRDKTLLNIWWSDELRYFKKVLSRENGRMKVDICRYCDG